MKAFALLAAPALVMAAPASAAVVYSNNFDSENGGLSAANYNGFNGLAVSNGTVDLVRSSDFGITCVGGTGSCVDLDGSTSDPGVLASVGSFAFGAGDTVTLAFSISGNQRGGADDFWTAEFDLGSAVGMFDAGYSVNGTIYSFGAIGPTNELQLFSPVFPDEPFTDYTFFLRPVAAGTVAFNFWAEGGDNIGPILDNVSLDISAVPEPATWAMMIGGFALAGAAMRRRKAEVRFA